MGEGRADRLCRKFTFYRQHLSEGVGGRAQAYLNEIRHLRVELDKIECDSNRRESCGRSPIDKCDSVRRPTPIHSSAIIQNINLIADATGT